MAFKLAILVSHPIQYYVPFFQLLARENTIHLKVFYSLGASENKVDKGFGQKISWDLPLLEGYDFVFLTNSATDQGSHHFKGIQNPKIVREIGEFEPDVLLVYGWAYHGHLKAIRYFFGKIPIWFRGDSTLMQPSSGYKRWFRKIFLSWVYRQIDVALYVGTRNKAYYQAFGIKESQLLFAPHAIDHQRFARDRSIEAAQIRVNLGIGETTLLVLFAGKMEAIKNPLLLIEAFGMLNKGDVHLLMVGSGPLDHEAKLAAEAYNERWEDGPRIHFMPFQNQTQMPAIYQSCDLFCLPSLSETWGLAVNEAMAAGKAVIISDAVGCAVDLVKAKVNGLIFRSNDHQSLVESLKGLTADKEVLRSMGIASRNIIASWSFEAQVKAIKAQLKHA